MARGAEVPPLLVAVTGVGVAGAVRPLEQAESVARRTVPATDQFEVPKAMCAPIRVAAGRAAGRILP
jgi:hypothetical protein